MRQQYLKQPKKRVAPMTWEGYLCTIEKPLFIKSIDMEDYDGNIITRKAILDENNKFMRFLF